MPSQSFFHLQQKKTLSRFLQKEKNPYLSIGSSANLSEPSPQPMAKARVSTNPMYTGGAGGYSFYVRQSEQIVRQRKNNSNYGESARRSRAQMERRVRWANLVNLYKACQSWMPKAFETKNANQTDYNAFMSVNVDRSVVALTKAQSQSGNAVWEDIQVSRGSLPSVQFSYDSVTFLFVSDITISNAITSATTVGELASDIIANNPQFVAGDNLAVIELDNDVDIRAMTASAWTRYAEVTLNVSDSTPLTQVPGLGDILRRSTSGFLSVSFPLGYAAGGVLIHTRKQSGRLLVSSQNAVLSGDEVVRRFSTSEWVETAILSYGLDTDVVLAPGDYEGGPSVLPTSAVGSIAGQSSSSVSSDRFLLSPGQYHVDLQPATWNVESFNDSDLAVYIVAENSEQQTGVTAGITIADFKSSGVANGFDIILAPPYNILRLSVRADTGVRVAWSARRY